MRPNINLGDVAKDTITGFEGVVVAKTEWLNGCIRLSIQPKKMHEGKPVDSVVFDIEQLELVKAAKVAKTNTGGDRPDVLRARDPR